MMRAGIAIAAWLACLPPVASAISTEAFLKPTSGEARKVLITGAEEDSILCKAADGTTTKIAKKEVKEIFIPSLPQMDEARSLFQARKYDAARTKSAALREEWKGLAEVPGNPAAAAAFIELECLRKSGDLEALAKTLANFDRRGLTRESERKQLELYAMWEAVRVKDWARTETIATAYLKDRLPAGQRAQAAYCLGLALEAGGKTEAAIDAFQTTLVADGATSAEIAAEAVLRTLRLYRKDPEVQAAMKTGKGPGWPRLLEAAALADLATSLPGLSQPLPADLAEFLKFRPEAAPKKP